jgi:photosystem II stability/assembly factor-like uncharacterized protein
VASSADGTKLVALVDGGQIYTSTDSGVTWTARDSNRDWIDVASSADGTKLVALVNGGQIYTFAHTPATAAQAITEFNSEISDLTAANAPGNDGTGTLAAVAETPLTGGSDALEAPEIPVSSFTPGTPTAPARPVPHFTPSNPSAPAQPIP